MEEKDLNLSLRWSRCRHNIIKARLKSGILKIYKTGLEESLRRARKLYHYVNGRMLFQKINFECQWQETNN